MNFPNFFVPLLCMQNYLKFGLTHKIATTFALKLLLEVSKTIFEYISKV